MSTQRRYAAGMAGISLGNGLLATSYLLDRTLLGPFTTLALVSTSLAALAAAVSLYATCVRTDDADLRGSTGATITVAGGIAAILGGLISLSFAVGG